MAIPGGVIVHVDNKDIIAYTSVASTAYVEGMLVKWSADNIVTPCTTAGEYACGICLDDLAAADNANANAVRIAHMGVFRLQAGAAVTRGVYLTVYGAGSYVYRPQGTTTGGHIVFGIAWTAQETAGSQFIAGCNFYNPWVYRTS